MSEYPLHGVGVCPDCLVGRRLEQVVASWHLYDSEAPSGPLDVWPINGAAVATHITTGSDWCLIVETSPPIAEYDMAESGRVEVAPDSGETAFADHHGKTDWQSAKRVPRTAGGSLWRSPSVLAVSGVRPGPEISACPASDQHTCHGVNRVRLPARHVGDTVAARRS
ncbi:hypothetical protein [Streptomyces zaomyceticus]|uniref:hypothetical protein n=1 Tax=Streptomyces zaomyceticus TaxID=68286 RepID=UPI0036C6E032